MKIDIISDIHIDFWIKTFQHCDNLQREVSNFVNDVLKPLDGDVLVIAGDLGHYFIQDTMVLLELKKYYNHIVLVKGNHDMYLVSERLRKKYKFNSHNRVIEMKEFCEENNIYYLDGETIEINGIKFGGVGMWYDTPNESDVEFWKDTMNDSNLIMEGEEPYQIRYGYGGKHKVSTFDTQKYYLGEVEKLKNLGPVDVLITHVCPILIPQEIRESKFRKRETDAFYMSNNYDIVSDINPKVLIFGHLHCSFDYVLDDIWCVSSPLGYKEQNLKESIKQITL